MTTNILNLNQEILITIKRIGINGEGIGYYKRLAIFVDGALPGEQVVVKITEIYNKYSKAVIVKFKGELSPFRIKPACPYNDKCGGCQFQHVSYEGQLKYKKGLLMEAFNRYYYSALNDKVFKDTIGMENPTRYRNKAKLPVRFNGEKLVTGLYAMDSNKLVYIEDCLVEREDVRTAVDNVCKLLTRHEVIAYSPKSKDGVLRHIVVRGSMANDELQVTLILFKDDKRTKKIAKDLIGIDKIESVYVSINDDLDSIESFGAVTEKIVGKDAIVEKIGNYQFELSPTSFFQLNLLQTKVLYDNIVKLGKFNKTDKIVDACCGVGTIGIYLSEHVEEVRGIDINAEAIDNANRNVELNNITNAKFYQGNITKTLKYFKQKGFVPDVLVIDPPRLGMELELINYLQKNPVKKIVYVSCNPATLAKNCDHLQKIYHILVAQPVDMFPYTSNVESIVCLEKRK